LNEKKSYKSVAQILFFCYTDFSGYPPDNPNKISILNTPFERIFSHGMCGPAFFVKEGSFFL